MKFTTRTPQGTLHRSRSEDEMRRLLPPSGDSLPDVPVNEIMLVVVGLLDETIWSQVVVFLRTLRQPFLPHHQHVTVLTSTAPPPDVIGAFEQLSAAFLVGPLHRVRNLLDAGIMESQTIVLLRGHSHEVESQQRGGDMGTAAGMGALADYELISVAGIMERILADSPRDQFIIYDLGCLDSVRLVEYTKNEVFRALRRHQATLHYSQTESFKSDLQELSFCSRMASLFKQLASNGQDFFASDHVDVSNDKLQFEQFFSSGQAVTEDLFGGMLGYMHHFPALIEFVEAFALPGQQRQISFPWQVRCPLQWVGRAFGELLLAWAGEHDSQLGDCGSVLVLAVYRKREPLRRMRRAGVRIGRYEKCGGIEGYNITLPGQLTTLLESDLLTVMGGRRFGEVMGQLGLLEAIGPCREECGQAGGIEVPWAFLDPVEPTASVLELRAAGIVSDDSEDNMRSSCERIQSKPECMVDAIPNLNFVQ